MSKSWQWYYDQLRKIVHLYSAFHPIFVGLIHLHHHLNNHQYHHYSSVLVTIVASSDCHNRSRETQYQSLIIMSSSIQSFFPCITKKEYEATWANEALESSQVQEYLTIKEELKILAKKKRTLQGVRHHQRNKKEEEAKEGLRDPITLR